MSGSVQAVGVANPDKLIAVRKHALPSCLASIIGIRVNVYVSGWNVLAASRRAIGVTGAIHI
jgi:hypothetical protein